MHKKAEKKGKDKLVHMIYVKKNKQGKITCKNKIGFTGDLLQCFLRLFYLCFIFHHLR